jgi:hypothetical protein
MATGCPTNPVETWTRCALRVLEAAAAAAANRQLQQLPGLRGPDPHSQHLFVCIGWPSMHQQPSMHTVCGAAFLQGTLGDPVLEVELSVGDVL